MRRTLIFTMLLMATLLWCPRADAVTINFENLTGNINGQLLEGGFRFLSFGALDVVNQGGNNVLSPSGYNDSFMLTSGGMWDSFSMDITTIPVTRSFSFLVGLLDSAGHLFDTDRVTLSSSVLTGLWHFDLDPSQMFSGLVFIDMDWCSNLRFDNLTFNAPSNGAAPVPEPATMTLMAAGLAGLAGLNRFRRRRDITAA